MAIRTCVKNYQKQIENFGLNLATLQLTPSESSQSTVMTFTHDDNNNYYYFIYFIFFMQTRKVVSEKLILEKNVHLFI